MICNRTRIQSGSGFICRHRRMCAMVFVFFARVGCDPTGRQLFLKQLHDPRPLLR